jgi:hypothetical protein
VAELEAALGLHILGAVPFAGLGKLHLLRGWGAIGAGREGRRVSGEELKKSDGWAGNEESRTPRGFAAQMWRI